MHPWAETRHPGESGDLRMWPQLLPLRRPITMLLGLENPAPSSLMDLPSPPMSNRRRPRKFTWREYYARESLPRDPVEATPWRPVKIVYRLKDKDGNIIREPKRPRRDAITRLGDLVSETPLDDESLTR